MKILLITLIFTILISGCLQVACTEDARICPDGSGVGRVPPDCEFAPCPPSKNCTNNNDCVVFGETGDCNCGCYNVNAIPTSTGGECFCQAPVACECIDNQCEGLFEECKSGNKTMNITQARQIAISSECGDRLKDTYHCNIYTGTWWIDLDIIRPLCNPACVIDIENENASINWRCTGAIP